MSKYDPLRDYLQCCNKSVLSLSFEEIEEIVGFSLPNSAYNHGAFWSSGNNSHSHAFSWIDAGYVVSKKDLIRKQIEFRKVTAGEKLPHTTNRKPSPQSDVSKKIILSKVPSAQETINVAGYDFMFLQIIDVERDSNGLVIEDAPQSRYQNIHNLKLHGYGGGTFCKFKISADEVPGVYLWIVDDEIIYIGETANLRNRFNTGYGVISARNCFEGGQTTNCKMNKVVLECAKQNKEIKLYFYQTEKFKEVELELLRSINTKYNVKDN